MNLRLIKQWFFRKKKLVGKDLNHMRLILYFENGSQEIYPVNQVIMGFDNANSKIRP